jgi:hypothetical protein
MTNGSDARGVDVLDEEASDDGCCPQNTRKMACVPRAEEAAERRAVHRPAADYFEVLRPRPVKQLEDRRGDGEREKRPGPASETAREEDENHVRARTQAHLIAAEADAGVSAKRVRP